MPPAASGFGNIWWGKGGNTAQLVGLGLTSDMSSMVPKTSVMVLAPRCQIVVERLVWGLSHFKWKCEMIASRNI